jgi:hypothetical protein
MTEQTTRRRGPHKLANPRSCRLSTMVTEAESNQVDLACMKAGITISDYIRRLLTETEKGR